MSGGMSDGTFDGFILCDKCQGYGEKGILKKIKLKGTASYERITDSII